MLDRPANPVSLRTPRAAELILIGLLPAAVLLAQVVVTRSTILFHHTFWLDEILTWTLVNDPSFIHAMSALHGGVDTNPPTMYLILWPTAKIFGGLNETGLHVFSFVSVIIALVGLFAICRRHFDPLPSFAGVMAVAAHPLVVHHAFEARFYGPWLAATVWYALAIARLRDTTSNRWLIISCILAIFAATVHYFGIVAVLLISAADLLVDRSLFRQRFRRAIPPLAGLLATCACIPFALGQREDLHVPTWIDPASFSTVQTMLTSLFGAPSVLWVLLGVWLLRIVQSARKPEQIDSHDLHDLVPLTALLLFPLVIIAFSILVQPSVLNRYMIVAVAPLSALAAYLASEKSRRFIGLLMLGLFAIGAAEIISSAQAVRGAEQEQQAVLDAIHSLDDSQPVVFKRRVEMFPLLRLAPNLLSRAALLDFDPSLDSRVRPFSVFERDMARKFERYYPSIKLVRLTDLSLRNSIFIIVNPDSAERYEVKSFLPGRAIEPRGPWMGEVLPRSATTMESSH